MVSDVALPRVNGVSTAIATYRNSLGTHGIKTRLIAPRYGHEPCESDTTRLSGWRVPFDPEDRLILPARLRRAVIDAACDADLIHIHTPFAAHYAGLAAARRLDLPVVATYHTLFEEYLHLYASALPERTMRALARTVSRAQCNALSASIVPSQAMARRLREYGIHTPIHVLPTGVPLEQFAVADRAECRARFRACHDIPLERPVALFVGRAAHEKNIDYLIEALGHAHESAPDLLLLIAGDGPAISHLQRLAQRSSYANSIRFIGYLDRAAQLPECYAAADFFVFASRTETQGLVLIEAMAIGLPVVALAAMGTCDLLESRRGALVPADDVGAFGAAMAQLANNSELRQRLGEEARALAADWSDRALTARLAALYGIIVAEQRMTARPLTAAGDAGCA
jgi:glycosyltransferase involved in cell wall biosynthesis